MRWPIKKLKHKKISKSPKPPHISPTTSTTCFPKINHFVVVNNANMTQIMMRITPFCSLLLFFFCLALGGPRNARNHKHRLGHMWHSSIRVLAANTRAAPEYRGLICPRFLWRRRHLLVAAARNFFFEKDVRLFFFRRDENHEGVRETKDEKVISTTFEAQY